MDKVTLLVSSFDGYSMCWPAFCHGLTKYWPDCPFPTLFTTNFKQAPCGETLLLGEDKGWATNLVFVLNQIKTPYIIYMQEDYWMDTPVNQKNIDDYVRLMDMDKADYIRLYPSAVPENIYPDDPRLRVIPEDAEYRTSLQAALWRKSVLIDLLDLTESPWRFEQKGGARSAKYKDRFLCVADANNGIGYVCTAILAGAWSKKAYTYAEREQITVDFTLLKPLPRSFIIRRNTRRFARKIKRRLKERLQAIISTDK